MALSPQWLDELKSRITLSGLIRRDVKLTRAGNEWKACCPFHNEKTPSFYVNDAKGFYHCFGCQKHGSAIDWMIEQRGLEFMDAVKELAAEAGMDVPAPDPREAQRAQQRAGLHDVMQAAQDRFADNLQGAAGERARAYLASRGFSGHTIDRFGFGYAPDDKGAIKGALEQFGVPMLIEAGLLIDVEEREPYDRFRDRLMLPIHDARGRVIAFGGRILEPRDGAPKYLNSPDTPLFDKGRTLYNLHRAGPASRKTGRLIAVEGYMDVIALADAGIEDVVAPMGTALTEAQIQLMWRLVDKPVLCFDGDAAGRRAAMKAIVRALPLLTPGHSLQIVQLPGGMDPDDLLKRDGKAAMERMLDAPRSMLDIIWETERDSQPLGGPEDKAGLKARLMAHVEAIENPDIKSLYRRELTDLYYAFAFPRREFPQRQGASTRFRGTGAGAAAARLAPQAAERLRKAAGGAFRDMLAQAVIAGLARYPSEIHRHTDPLLHLAANEPRLAEAINVLLDLAQVLEGDGSDIISTSGNLPPAPDNTRFSFLVEGSDPDEAREDLAEAVALLVERPSLDAAIKAATARFATDPEGAFAEQQRLRKRKLEIESRLGQMARKRASQAQGDEITRGSA